MLNGSIMATAVLYIVFETFKTIATYRLKVVSESDSTLCLSQLDRLIFGPSAIGSLVAMYLTLARLIGVVYLVFFAITYEEIWYIAIVLYLLSFMFTFVLSKILHLFNQTIIAAISLLSTPFVGIAMFVTMKV